MRMRHLALTSAFLILAASAVPHGCHRDKDDPPVPPPEPPGDPVADRAVAGRVVDVDTLGPLAGVGVEITATGHTTTTDSNGFYSFEDLSQDSVILRFSRAGYATNVKEAALEADTTTLLGVSLKAAGPTRTIVADQGGAVQEGASTVSIPPGALVKSDGSPVTGDVDIVVTYVDPSTSSVLSFPGSFQAALDSTSNPVELESFGFATYSLSQGGEEVDLQPGSVATITYVLPDNAQGRFLAGDPIPLWEFDEATATWIQAGVGTVQEDANLQKLVWVAEVPHFSSWNADAPITEKSCLQGRVVGGGAPVEGAEITVVGRTYNGTSTAFSEADGTFCVEVKNASLVDLEVRVNAGAAPVAKLVDLTVPPGLANCADGGCVQLADIDITFDACVQGRVVDSDGVPLVGADVFIVPGETTVTDANGEYCGRAPLSTEVTVFVPGMVSATVTTSGLGADCATGPCTEADLTLNLPRDGDLVGLLDVFKTALSDGQGGTLAGTFMTGYFFAGLSDELLLDIDFATSAGSSGACLVMTEEVDGCTVFTQTCDADGTVNVDPEDIFLGLSPVDAGERIQAATPQGASVDLLRGPLDGSPLEAGIYLPELLPDGSDPDLLALGFDGGTTVGYDSQGGLGLGPLAGAIDVPPDLLITGPDFGATPIDLTQPLTITWEPADPASTVHVEICSSVTVIVGFPPTITNELICVQTSAPDTDGSATVPATCLARLHDAPETLEIFAWRATTTEITAPLPRTGGEARVLLSAQNEVEVYSDFAEAPGGKSGAELSREAYEERRSRRRPSLSPTAP